MATFGLRNRFIQFCSWLLLALLLLNGPFTTEAKKSKRSTRSKIESDEPSQEAEISTKELITARGVDSQGMQML